MENSSLGMADQLEGNQQTKANEKVWSKKWK
jgi:hypothetical protein